MIAIHVHPPQRLLIPSTPRQPHAAPDTPPPPCPGSKAHQAAELAQRNTLIVRLVREGEAPDSIALLTGMTRRQVNRIVASAPSPSPMALLTPTERRDLRREHRCDPRALEWLAAQRTDRRRNGASMADSDPAAALYEDALDHVDRHGLGQ